MFLKTNIMEDTIVITTEEVKVNELKDRDKVIWEHGYNRGFKNATDKNPLITSIGKAIYVCVVLFFIVVLIYAFTRMVASDGI
jgi:hypothetical protein